MLRIIQAGYSLPISFPVDPTSEFQPGQIGQLKVIGNEIVCGVSDGTQPLGIIDDINTNAFTAPQNDEVIIIPATGVWDGYSFKTPVEVSKVLAFSNIVRSSFVSDVSGITLNDINGVITAPSGTDLNYDSDGDGIDDSIRVIVSYIYRIPNVPGDNTTIGSGRITIWFQRGIFETDQYDVHQKYAVGSTLFVDSDGKLTSRQPSANHPGIGMVTGPPSGINNTLEFIWF